MLYKFLHLPYNPPPFECCLMLQIGHQFQAILFSGGGGGGEVGLGSNLLEMNHKISPYYVD